MSRTTSNGVIYSTTAIRIEEDIKNRAKELNINFSKTFKNALLEEIKRIESEI